MQKSITLIVLPALYISLLLLTVALCFIKIDLAAKYKKMLITSHFLLFLLLILDVSAFNFKGVWIDRLIVIAFLDSAATVYLLYQRSLKILGKLYFGAFFFYPFLLPFVFLMDRLMFAIVSSPLVVALTIPETKFSNKDFVIRVPEGIMAGPRIQLMKKGSLTETSLGICHDLPEGLLDISNLQIADQTPDSTVAIITSAGKSYRTTFYIHYLR